ncbi:MAG TPA: hypothetical protein VGI29_11140 [Candidatus Binataceae bacterium]
MDADDIIRSHAAAQSVPARGVRPNVAAGCLYLFALPFCGFGIFALAMAVGYMRAGNPAQAAYGTLFAIVFGGVGCGLIYALRRGTRMIEGRDRLRAAHPDEPWLWRKDWAAGHIPASNANSPLLLGGLAALCFVIGAPVIYEIPREMARGNNLVLLILLFPLAGLSLLAQAVRARARLRLVRGAAFEMDSVPGQIGGTLAGKIVLPQTLRPTGGFTLGLRCVNRVTSGSGDSTSTWEHVLWNDEQTAAFDGATVPVAFYIAPDTPASDDADRNNEIIWRLAATAPTAAGPFDAQFEVPVFKVAETAEQRRLAESVRAAEHRQTASYVHPEASRITMRLTPGGATEVYFPPLRSPGAALVTAAFTAIWSACLWLMFVMRAPRMFEIGWGVFEAILVLILLSMFAAVRVRVGDGAVTIVKSLAGIVYSRRQIAAGDVSSVAAVPGMTSGTTVYYQLRISFGGGRRYDFADGIGDKREADWLADQISQRLGLKQE